MGYQLLKDSHSQMMAYHTSKGIELPDGVQSALPTQAIVAFWDPSITWSGGAWHSNVRPPHAVLHPKAPECSAVAVY